MLKTCDFNNDGKVEIEEIVHFIIKLNHKKNN